MGKKKKTEKDMEDEDESEEEEYYPMSTGALPPPVVPASILEKIPPKKDRMLCKKTPEKPENPPEKKSKKNKGKRKEKKLGSESGMKVLYKQMTSKYKQGPLVDPNNNKKNHDPQTLLRTIRLKPTPHPYSP